MSIQPSVPFGPGCIAGATEPPSRFPPMRARRGLPPPTGEPRGGEGGGIAPPMIEVAPDRGGHFFDRTARPNMRTARSRSRPVIFSALAPEPAPRRRSVPSHRLIERRHRFRQHEPQRRGTSSSRSYCYNVSVLILDIREFVRKMYSTIWLESMLQWICRSSRYSGI